VNNFQRLDICYLGPDSLSDDGMSGRMKWEGTLFEGSWRRRVNAGGCRNYPGLSSSVRLSSVCLSVMFVRPTQQIEIFTSVSVPFGTLAISDLSVKILQRSSQAIPPSGGLF